MKGKLNQVISMGSKRMSLILTTSTATWIVLTLLSVSNVHVCTSFSSSPWDDTLTRTASMTRSFSSSMTTVTAAFVVSPKNQNKRNKKKQNIASFLQINTQNSHESFKEKGTTTSLKMVGRSAFGKAAIGLKNKNQTDLLLANSRFINSTISDSNIISPPKESAETKRLLFQRDRALLALQQHLRLSTEKSLQLLTTNPSLYTDVPSLSLKLLYLLNELNIPRSRLVRMLETHPTLTTRVILDSEANLSSTLQVLQEELDLRYADLKAIITKSSNLPTLLNYGRSNLKRKIRLYTSGYLSITPSVMTQLICTESRMLQMNPVLATQVINILRNTLNMSRDDIVTMLQRDKLLLCYHPTENTKPTIDYLMGDDSQIGHVLGLVLRKSESTLLLPASISEEQQNIEEEKQQLIKSRIKDLLIRYPAILSCGITTHLQPILSFLRNDVGCTDYQLGRMLYRRGNILTLSLDSLKRKVDYFNTVLSLTEEEGEEIESAEKNGSEEETNSSDICSGEKEAEQKDPVEVYESYRDEYGTKLSHILATSPDVLTLSLKGNLQPKFQYIIDTFLVPPSPRARSIVDGNGHLHLHACQKQQLSKIFQLRPQLLVLSLEKNWKPKVQYLSSSEEAGGAGLSPNQVWDWWVAYPHMMSFTLEKIEERVNVVKKIIRNKRISTTSTDFWWQSLNDNVEGETTMVLEANFLGWKEKKWRTW